jgi:WD40 repeat protein
MMKKKIIFKLCIISLLSLFAFQINADNSLQIAMIKADTKPVRTVTTNPNSQSAENLIVYTGHDDGFIRAWNISTKRMLWQKKIHQKEFFSLKSFAVSNDKTFLLSASVDGTSALIDTEAKLISKLTGHNSWVYGADYFSIMFGASYIATVSKDKTLKLWKYSDDNVSLQASLIAHSLDVNCVKAFSPDQSYYYANEGVKPFVKIVTGSDDKTIKIWHWTGEGSPKTEKVLTGHIGHIYTVDTYKDELLASGDWSNEIIIWDFKTGRIIKRLKGHTAGIMKVLFINKEEILSSSKDKTIKRWNIKTGKCIYTYTGHTNIVDYIALTPNNENFVSSSHDGTIRLWKIKASLSTAELNRKLIQAIYSNEIDKVKNLIKLHADKNANTSIMEEWASLTNLSGYYHQKFSALAFAKMLGHNEIVDYLKQIGAIEVRGGE